MATSPEKGDKRAQGRYASSNDTHARLSSGPNCRVDIVPWVNCQGLSMFHDGKRNLQVTSVSYSRDRTIRRMMLIMQTLARVVSKGI